MTTPTKLVIDRKRWLRGEGDRTSFLLRPSDGKMCCLGFFGLACGIPASLLDGVPAPQSVLRSEWPAWLVTRSDIPGCANPSSTCVKLMTLNDDDPDETHIARIFREHGVEVIFVDEPKEPAAGAPEESPAPSPTPKEK
jgi:hypothetical protein